MKNQCQGSGVSTGVTGLPRRKVVCPFCGRKIGMRSRLIGWGRLVPHSSIDPLGMWAVADEDEGALRLEPSRRAALDWWLEHSESRVFGRERCTTGLYKYFTGSHREMTDSIWVGRVSALAQDGWNMEQPPLYPDPEDPHREVHPHPEYGDTTVAARAAGKE